MAYSITTKDGITINNIPDDVAPDSPDLKARVAAIRAGGGASALEPPAPAPAPGFFAGLAETITGAKRSASPDVAAALKEGRTIYDMPETNQLSFGLIKSALGGLLANPEEKAKIFQANIPGITYRKDEMGTIFLRSPTDNKEYVIEPGLTSKDIPAVVGGIAAFTPAGRAATIPGAIAGAGATQAVIEASQAATGGAFSPAEIGIAAATGPAGQILQRVAPPVVQAVKAGARRITGRPAPVMPPPTAAGAPMGTAMTPEAPPVAAIPEPVIVPEVPPAAAPVAPAAAEAVETVAEAAPMNFTAQMERTDVSEVLELARKAAGIGPGSSAAKARLIDMAQVNPEAAAAAQRLNIDLPFDVLSDNAQVRSAVGLTRAKVAGEAEAAWEATTRAAIQRADEISQEFDAAFIAGRPATGATSQKILDNLTNTRDTLKADSAVIYNRIDGIEGGADGLVPKATPVALNNLQQTLQKVMTEVGETGLSQQEKKLLELATQPGVTYGRLLREKSLIGKAQAGLESPYGSMAEADLKRLYGALAQDQLDNVGTIAGDEVRRELRAANLMTAKRKALEKRIVGAFGKEIDGSVAQKMQSAISTASKGDAAAFNRLMKVVPEDLRKETVATALASVTAGKAAGRAGAGETVFSPAEYTKVYRGLRANPPVYAQMVKIMGPEWDRASRDLYEVSKRIADAQARIPTTGKANQILGDMAINGLFNQVISSGAAQRVVTGVVGTIPGGGLIAPDIIGYMAGAKGAGIEKAAKLFADPAFQKLAVETATTGQASNATLRSTAMSQSFQKFADQIKLPKELDARIQFLQSAIQTERQQENK
jgi:hypothetical protein